MSDGESAVFPCRYCNETGMDPGNIHSETLVVSYFNESIDCAVCRGAAEVRIETRGKTVVNCNACKGTGRMQTSHNGWTSCSTCYRCKGLGIRALITRSYTLS
jgi:hypothetical protein